MTDEVGVSSTASKRYPLSYIFYPRNLIRDSLRLEILIKTIYGCYSDIVIKTFHKYFNEIHVRVVNGCFQYWMTMKTQWAGKEKDSFLS